MDNQGGFGNAGTGVAGGATTSFGGQNNVEGGQFGGDNQSRLGGGQGDPSQTKFFQIQSDQSVSSLQVPFELKRISLDDGKGGNQSLRYRNILSEERFQTCSSQMLRLIDMARAGGRNQEVPEWKA